VTGAKAARNGVTDDPMKQKMIDFRELLERVLPLDELPPADRFHVQRALRSGVASQIEQAAMLALARLEQFGTVKRIPTPGNGGGVVRYQPRDTIDVITVQLPEPRQRDGIIIYPRSSLPAQARAGLEQVRRLLRLDDPLLSSDPRRPDARIGLIEQLNQAGREVLGATQLHFIPAGSSAESEIEGPLDPELAREASEHPDAIYYCPDTGRCPMIEGEARRRQVQAVVMAGVPSSEGHALGLLQVTSAQKEPFRPEDLAMVALLADYCAGVLERAARIEKIVFIDPLTQIYNKSYFELQLPNEMARAKREGSPMALCIADIDNFKSFNSAFGYEAGNQVLIQVARSLKRAVRPFDTVARWGGEEFAVLLTAPVQAQDVMTISERLRQLVERQAVRIEALDRQSHRVVVTVSIGVALFPDHESTGADLWRAANQALLEAKHPPKNRVVFYRPPEARPRAFRREA